MSEIKEIVAVGSIAFDSIETPKGKREHMLGGSATFFGIGASIFSKVHLIGVVGNDFSDKDWDIFNKFNINTSSIHSPYHAFNRHLAPAEPGATVDELVMHMDPHLGIDGLASRVKPSPWAPRQTL